MKKLATLCYLIYLLTMNSHAQCLEVISVTFNGDGTTTILLDALNSTEVIDPSNNTVYPDGNNQLTWTGTIIPGPYSFPNLVWGVIEPSFCPFSFTPNLDLFLDYSDIYITTASACEDCDGEVCVNMTGVNYPEFEIDSEQSFEGCIANLCTGSYELDIEPITDSDNVIYYNYPQQIGLLGIALELTEEDGEIFANISGGSGNYSYEILGPASSSSNEPLQINGTGCYKLSVADLNDDCEVGEYFFFSETCYGDFNDDGFVNTADLLLFLPELYETPVLDIYDPNCDGVLNTGDLLEFLAVFGTSC